MKFSAAAFRVIGGLRVLGVKTAPTVRIVAQAGTLQSQTQTFAVIAPPTRIVLADSTMRDSIVYDQPDSSKRVRDVRVAVVRDTAVGRAPEFSNGLRVLFRVAASDPLLDSVRVIPTSGGRAVTSALMAAGAASVRIRVYPKATATTTGTLTIEASVRVLGRDVSGSPFRFPVRLVPFTLPR